MLYEVSWSKKGNFFRWIDPEGLVYEVHSAEGEMDMMGTKNEIGRLMVSCVLDLVDGHATLSPVPGSVAELPPAEAVLLDWAGYCRMCYRRNQSDWRAVDEKRVINRSKGTGTPLGSGKVQFVSTYVGRVKLYWYDKGSHLFHGHPERGDGLVSILNNVAYLH